MAKLPDRPKKQDCETFLAKVPRADEAREVTIELENGKPFRVKALVPTHDNSLQWDYYEIHA